MPPMLFFASPTKKGETEICEVILRDNTHFLKNVFMSSLTQLIELTVTVHL